VFLFLQGPPGEGFSRLADGLRAQGAQVVRVNFNGGDFVNWRESGAYNFRGGPNAWPAYLSRLMARKGVTDIVLFGDCRPLHRAAVTLASMRGVRVHVFEEGYIRPDWVTIEIGGVNGYSRLPRTPDWYRRTAVSLPVAPEQSPLPSAIGARGWRTFVYYAACVLLAPVFPFYRTHRPVEPVIEALGWIVRAARRGREQRWTAEAIRNLESGSYFLLPLQLDSDAQIRVHSNFRNVRESLERVIASFARHAPPDAKLLVKQHPLDSGLSNWRRVVAETANAFGVYERVAFCERGDIGALISDARGVVTVNSTVGALALAAGVPLICLGVAVYDIDGLTFQDGLNAFWSQAAAPDADLYRAFHRVLAHHCLAPGGFFGEEALSRVLDVAIKRLIEPAHILECVAVMDMDMDMENFDVRRVRALAAAS
jgi:capsular polysaccharide export protein